eukprot:CAMPEP_0172756122 /NCGR_PEP_ID=MMETSP1074-20121228/161177_1 /TAXON_ID=2916 /ORGANISM="Ceratium fusus, Strain PA161109" /LENGTH=646 /DNA_ID=CAMNT_0013589331 /DNA_START=162 /DNA_END=2102 /DNA_ORIENTATION=-
MSFGGGALLFALSVELFGNTLHEIDRSGSHGIVWVMEGTAIAGGCLFAALNRALNSRGADLRKRSLAKVRFVRMRKIFVRRLIQRMGKLKLFSELTPSEVGELVISTMEKKWYPSGDKILEFGDPVFNVYFIISGRVRVEVFDESALNNDIPDSPRRVVDTFDLGPDEIFGEMPRRRVTTLLPTKLLVLPAEDLARLMEMNASVRRSMAKEMVEQLRFSNGLMPLPDELLSQIVERTSLETFRPNEAVPQASFKDVDALCVCFGKVEILQAGAARRLLCAGHVISRSSLSFPEARVDAVALELTTVLRLRCSDVHMISPPGSGQLAFLKTGINPSIRCSKHECADTFTVPGQVMEDSIEFDAEVCSVSAPNSSPRPTVAVEIVKSPELLQNIQPTPRSKELSEEVDEIISLQSQVQRQVSFMALMSDTDSVASGIDSKFSESEGVDLKVTDGLVSDMELEERDLLLRPLERRRSKEPISPKAAKDEVQHGGGGVAAVMVWLGILIDGVPESVVIGILVNKTNNSPSGVLPFIIGVFLSNLPESMSSSGMMKAHGMRVGTILGMWLTITLTTVVGGIIGAVAFPPGSDQEPATRYFVAAVEGVAGGAMLTMIAQTMMPEAFEQGGDVVGLSCLVGFLCALSTKLLDV